MRLIGTAFKNRKLIFSAPWKSDFKEYFTYQFQYTRVQTFTMMAEHIMERPTTAKNLDQEAAPFGDVASSSPKFDLSSLEEFELGISTFNILAPCYKRIGNKVRGGALKPRPRESEFPELWIERANKICEYISSDLEDSEIICLQEYWYEPAFQTPFQKTLASKYHFYGAQRTGNKTDGLLILIDKSRFKVTESRACKLSEVGQRIGLMLHVQKKEGQDPGFLILNTHLSFPHTSFERQQQRTQVRTITKMLEDYKIEANLPQSTPKIIVGDFNVEESDPVFSYLKKKGYRSSRKGDCEFVSHYNHRGEAVGVDHILIHAQTSEKEEPCPADETACPGYGVDVMTCAVKPNDIDGSCWPQGDFDISDHRPLTSRLKFFVQK